MPKNLLIVESPAKAKTIEKILGENFQVKSCFGHIRDLQKAGMGIDLDKKYTNAILVKETNDDDPNTANWPSAAVVPTSCFVLVRSVVATPLVTHCPAARAKTPSAGDANPSSNRNSCRLSSRSNFELRSAS